MDIKERRIKDLIREGIWSGILELNKEKIFNAQNPYRLSELLESSQEFLNTESNRMYFQVQQFSKEL